MLRLLLRMTDCCTATGLTVAAVVDDAACCILLPLRLSIICAAVVLLLCAEQARWTLVETQIA